MARRFGCLRIPHFPLSALLRDEPALSTRPVVLADRADLRGIVLDTNAVASESGARHGMKVSRARLRAPDLVVLIRDRKKEAETQRRAVELARNFSPRVEDGGNGRVLLDLGTHTDSRTEAQLAERMTAEVTEDLGLPVRIGIAAQRMTATLATELPTTPHVVPVGGDQDLLSRFPVDRLTTSRRLGDTLRRWGIHSLGDLLTLSGDDLLERLGAPALELRHLAAGHEPRPWTPTPLPHAYEESVDLDWVLPNAEPLLFLVQATLGEIRTSLVQQGQACHRVELELRLDSGAPHQIAISLKAPSRDPKVLSSLLRMSLAENPPPAGVIGFRLRLHPSPARETQLPLFGVPQPRADQVEMILVRLLAILGHEEDRGTLHLAGSHRPEALNIRPFTLEESSSPGTSMPRRPFALRRLTTLPETELEVSFSKQVLRLLAASPSTSPPPVPKGLPGRVRARATDLHALAGGVEWASGPWSLSGEWWTHDPLELEVWDLELESDAVLRVFRDLPSGEWHLGGLFD